MMMRLTFRISPSARDGAVNLLPGDNHIYAVNCSLIGSQAFLAAEQYAIFYYSHQLQNLAQEPGRRRRDVAMTKGYGKTRRY